MTEQVSQDDYFGLPVFWFQRPDDESDDVFYEQPRMVAHIDDATMLALTDFYQDFLPEDAHILDLMSSWLSHLPRQKPFARVAGLGMNAEELAANTSYLAFY